MRSIYILSAVVFFIYAYMNNCSYINKEKTKAEILNVINNEDATFADGEKAWSDFYPYLWEKNFLKHIY